MKDFGAEQIATGGEERGFKVNGTLFRLKPSMAALRVAAFDDAITGDHTSVEYVQIMQTFVAEALEPGQEDAWQAANDPNAALPLNLFQIEEIVKHTRVMLGGRPFENSPDSGGTPETTGTISTDASPSPEATSQT
jgi:hypothetical protein